MRLSRLHVDMYTVSWQKPTSGKPTGDEIKEFELGCSSGRCNHSLQLKLLGCASLVLGSLERS